MADPNPTRRRVLELGGSAVLAALAGCSGKAPTAAANAVDGAADPQNQIQQTTESSTPEDDPESPYTEVYRDVAESVVLVQTEAGLGSGFLVEGSYVVTNAHVVGDASTTQIRFSGGEWVSGDVVGTDAHSDLAVISIPEVPEGVDPLSFADDPAVVGQEVVAIGNPFDLGGTATAGIVSGVNRLIPAPTGARIPDAIQTDAAVNPGNSGGPLVSLDGDVVAVISSGGGENIAFGISAALADRVVTGLVEGGDYEHPFLGVSLANVTPAVASEIGMSESRGVLVTDVLDGGPADGVLRGATEIRSVDGYRLPVGGDVILSINGQQVQSVEDLSSFLALNTRPGDTVDLQIRRDGTVETAEVELGTRPSP